MIERYRQIFLTVGFGALTGITLSFFAASLVSLLFISLSGEGLLESLWGFVILSFSYGLVIAGIPSAIIGLVTGLVVGIFMYRSRGSLSDDKAVTIGLLSSLAIMLFVFLLLVLIADVPALELLFPLLTFGTVYVLGSCAISVLVYRKYFRVVSEVIEEQ